MSKTTVVYHPADFDGLFCREIARKFLPDAELIGWDFGDLPIAIKTDTLYVMDLPCDRPFGLNLEDIELIEDPDSKGYRMGGTESKELVWIDHHKTAIESHPPGIPGYRIDGVAACRLAWQWFAEFLMHDPTAECHAMIPGSQLPTKEAFIERKVQEPYAVRLAGEYDIWDKRDLNAELFQHGLKSIELTASHWYQLLSSEIPKSLIGTGLEDTESGLLTS